MKKNIFTILALAIGAFALITACAPPIDGGTTLSNDANLSALAISSGTLTPAFAAGTTSYTCSVSNATASVTVTPTKTDAGAVIAVQVNGGGYTAVISGNPSGSLALNVGDNPIDVRVTAQDTTTVKIYTITVTRAASGPSNNANLSALTISSGAFNEPFDSNTLAYTQSVAYAVSSATVTPTAAGAGATITVNGIGVASGSPSGSIAFSVGPNTITIIVTAQDTITTKTYTITVTRAAAGPSNNADLSALTISSGAFNEPFDSNTLAYTQSVAYAVSSATVTPTAADAGATITVNGIGVTSGSPSGSISLSVGPNTITIIVTAEDTITTKTYTITVTRAAASNNANLSALTISSGTLAPVFASGTTTYRDIVMVSSVTVTPTAANGGATIGVQVNTGGYSPVSSGTPSGSLPLNNGSGNTIDVLVTAEDTITTKTYNISVFYAATNSTPASWTGAAYNLFGSSGSAPSGSISVNTQTAVTMTSAGGNVNTSNRRFYFASTTITGDFVFTARLSSVTGTFTVLDNNAYRYGLLFCENLTTVSNYIDLSRFAELGYFTATAGPTFTGSRAYKLDVGTGSALSRTSGAWTVPNYLRLVRWGNTIQFYTSTDNVTYTLANSSTLLNANGNPISNSWYLGFYGAPGTDSLTFAYDTISILQ